MTEGTHTKTQKINDLNELRFEYARNKAYLADLEKWITSWENYRSFNYMYEFVIICGLFCVVISILLFNIFYLVLMLFFLFPNLLIWFTYKSSLNNKKTLRKEVSNEIDIIKEKIIGIVNSDLITSDHPINKDKYFSEIYLNKELMNRFDDLSTKHILCNFYNIPRCFERSRDILYDLVILDRKEPFCIKDERIIEKRSDIKLEMYVDKGDPNEKGEKVFPRTPNVGHLYITNNRLLYIRKPYIKNHYECNKILKKESKKWLSLHKYECISIPLDLVQSSLKPFIFKDKKVTIFLKSQYNNFGIDITSDYSISSIVRVIEAD